MGEMDQDALRFEGNCTLQLPRSSTHCTDCFATIAAFQNKVRRDRSPAVPHILGIRSSVQYCSHVTSGSLLDDSCCAFRWRHLRTGS